MIRRLRSSRRTARESYALSPSTASGRRRGWPGRPATGGTPSTRARVCVMSLTFAAVVMTLSGVPFPSQIRWCLLPVLRRSTGDGPVAAPSFSRGRGSRPRTRATSRVRRPRSVRRAGGGAAVRRLRPSASGSGASSTSVRSRTPVPGAGVARRCPDAGRTECPAGIAGRPPASAPVTARARAAAAVRSVPTSRRPRSTAEASHDVNGRIITSVTLDQGASTRSCYELLAPAPCSCTDCRCRPPVGGRRCWPPCRSGRTASWHVGRRIVNTVVPPVRCWWEEGQSVRSRHRPPGRPCHRARRR